jgi:hypothetical protein
MYLGCRKAHHTNRSFGHLSEFPLPVCFLYLLCYTWYPSTEHYQWIVRISLQCLNFSLFLFYNSKCDKHSFKLRKTCSKNCYYGLTFNCNFGNNFYFCCIDCNISPVEYFNDWRTFTCLVTLGNLPIWSRIWGSHSSDYKEFYLPAYNTK